MRKIVFHENVAAITQFFQCHGNQLTNICQQARATKFSACHFLYRNKFIFELIKLYN